MNKLDIKKQAQIISALVEGNSIRATCRMTGVAKGTVLKLLADIGDACAEYQHKHLRDLTCNKIQCDEIWSFCYAKDKNVPKDKKGKFGYGDIWTWTAICADSKLVPSFFIGTRDLESAKVFMNDLASRMRHRIQITTDGHKAYIEAVEDAFGSDVDYSQIVKLYGVERIEDEARYSPAKCIGAKKKRINGNPDDELALHFMYYNFCRVHQTLRVTPAMEAKVTDHVWDIEEILTLIYNKCDKNE